MSTTITVVGKLGRLSALNMLGELGYSMFMVLNKLSEGGGAEERK